MNLDTYLLMKQRRELLAPNYKVRCMRCLQPTSWCYCKSIFPINCGIKFVILIHPLERRRRIATGRMSHLMLHESELIHGHSFAKDARVNELIQDPRYSPFLLHLDESAVQIDTISNDEKQNLFFANKRLLVFVVDGTWGTASKTVRLSPNLNRLPKISFTPKNPSLFRVRRQPNSNCYSTIEAIHETIELLSHSKEGKKFSNHDRLLSVFEQFVSKQVECIESVRKNHGKLQYRVKKRVVG